MRNGVLALLCVSVWPSVVAAALTCGSVTTNITATDRSSVTISYATPAGSELLVVGVASRDGTGNDTVSSLTHAGSALTKKVGHNHTTAESAAELWVRPSPASGTNNVVVTWSGVVFASGVFIMSCTGVQSGSNPFRAANSAEGSSTTPGVTTTAVTGDLVLDVMAHDGETTAPTVGADQTVIFAASPGTEFSMGASYQAGADGGGMNWTTAVSNDWAMVAASLQESTTSFLMMRRRNP